MVFWYAPTCPVDDDGGLCGLGLVWASSRFSGGTRPVTGGTGSCFEPVGV